MTSLTQKLGQKEPELCTLCTNSDRKIKLNKGSFKKYVHRAGEGGSLKSELKRAWEGRVGQVYLYVCSVKKNCLILKQQAEFFLISCLAVAKCFLF